MNSLITSNMLQKHNASSHLDFVARCEQSPMLDKCISQELWHAVPPRLHCPGVVFCHVVVVLLGGAPLDVGDVQVLASHVGVVVIQPQLAADFAVVDTHCHKVVAASLPSMKADMVISPMLCNSA